jgi:hypothetical protein
MHFTACSSVGLFVSEWHPHVTEFAHRWEDDMRMSQGAVREQVALFDCDEQRSTPVCGRGHRELLVPERLSTTVAFGVRLFHSVAKLLDGSLVGCGGLDVLDA